MNYAIHGLLIHARPTPLVLDIAKALIKEWTKPDVPTMLLVYDKREGEMTLWNRNAHWIAAQDGAVAVAAAKGLALHLDSVNKNESFGALVQAEDMGRHIIVVSPDPDVLKPYTFSPVLELKYPEHP